MLHAFLNVLLGSSDRGRPWAGVGCWMRADALMTPDPGPCKRSGARLTIRRMFISKPATPTRWKLEGQVKKLHFDGAVRSTSSRGIGKCFGRLRYKIVSTHLQRDVIISAAIVYRRRSDRSLCFCIYQST